MFDAKDDDPQAERRLVLSHAAWTQFFGADPSVIGRRVMVREEATPQPFEVIGVMPPEFFFPRGAQYWTTAAPRLEAIARHTGQPRADLFGKLGVFYALGRLKPGVSVEDARREMPSYLKAVADQFRIDLSTFRIIVTPLLDFVFGPARQTLWLLMAAVALVLLIARGNVAGLVFARAASRRRELAVRAALGASRGVLVRQLLAESALIAFAGGLLGVAGAAAVLETLVALSPADIPRLNDAGIDWPVALFALATALVATSLVGLVPALRASRTSLVDDMKNGSMGAGQAASPGRGVLVAVQVAGTLVLLIATGLCVRSFAKLSDLDLGFNPAQVLTFSVTGLNEAQSPSRAARHDLVDRLLASVEQLPQVRTAGAILQRPFEHGPIGMDSSVLLEGQAATPDESNRNGVLNWESVTPGYFASMNIRLLRGRIFDERDRANATLSAIVSEATANRLWPGKDPIGRRVRLSFTEDDLWHTVVGVVATARYREITNPRFDIYVAMRQSTSDVQHFTVRTNGDPLSATAAVEAAIKNVDPRLSIDGVTTMDAVVRRVRGPWHFTLIVFALFGVIAGGTRRDRLVRGGVLRRDAALARDWRAHGARRNAWPRDSIDARPGRRPGRRRAARGRRRQPCAHGAPCSRCSSTSAPAIWLTFGSVVMLFGLVIATASYLPARRAGRIDPQSALRHE